MGLLQTSFVSVVVCLTVASAQQSAGQLDLTVKDPSGAPMVAAGTLHNLTAGTGRAFQTNAAGAYHFDNLPLGRYQLEVRKTGFGHTN